MMYGYMGSVYVHAHARRRQPLPWKWIKWQMVSEPEPLLRAEFMLSCFPVLREGTNKGEPSKNGWQIASNRLCHRQRVEWQPFACSLLPPPTHTVPACKILSEMETKEKTSVDVQSPSLRKTRGSVLHRETRTCYYQPKYQNLGQIVWGENTQLKLY